MNIPSHEQISLSICILFAFSLGSFAAQTGDSSYTEKVFPAGIFGEMTVDMLEHYSLSWNQDGLLMSYRYRSLDDHVLDESGVKPARDALQEMNAQLIAAIIEDDMAKYSRMFLPDDYAAAHPLTEDQAKGFFGLFRRKFSDSTDALVTGDVTSKGHRDFVVQLLRNGSKNGPSVVLGYEEYTLGKWRFCSAATAKNIEPEFVTALLGPPLDTSALPKDWERNYVILPLPYDDDSIPADKILLRVQKLGASPTGNVIVSVLDTFLSAMRAFPDDKPPTPAMWEKVAAAVTKDTLEGLQEGYAKGQEKGIAPASWKWALFEMLGAWEGRRFVVDCGKMAYLLCIDDIHPTSVGCVSFLKQGDGSYRLCNINVQAAFVGLFYKKDFCVKLKEKLQTLP